MKSLRLAAALLAAVLPVTALVLPASPAQAAGPLLKVMPLGDSITRGSSSDPWGLGYRQRLLNRVSQQGQYTVDYVGSMTSDAAMSDMDHEGHSGWTTDQLRASIDTWMSTERPDVVLLHAGINDLKYQGDTPEAVVSQLDDLVNRIILNRPDVAIVLSGLLPATVGLGDKVAAVNAGARQIADNEVAQGNKVRYVDMPVTSASQMHSDGLHPNNAGYTIIADSYFDGLSRVVADGWATDTFDSFSGDARADLVVHDGSNVWVRKGLSTDKYDSGAIVTQGWGRYHGLDVADGLGQIHYADYDGDHKTDMIVHDGSDVSVRINKGGWFDTGRNVSSGWGRYHGLHIPDGLGRLYFADYNDDGKADMIVHHGSDLSVRLNNGNNTGFGGGYTIGTGWGRYHGLHVTDGLGRLYFADYDGDGRDDLVVHHGTDVSIRLNNGFGFDGGRSVTSGWGRYHGLRLADGLGQLYFADQNGDGKDDLIVHHGTDVNARHNKGNNTGFDGGRLVTSGWGRYHGMYIPNGLGSLSFA